MAINTIPLSEKVTLRRITDKSEIALLYLGGRTCDITQCPHQFNETDYHLIKKPHAVWSRLKDKTYKITGAWKWDYVP